MRAILFSLILFVTYGCLDSPGRKGRPLIEPIKKTETNTCYLDREDWKQGTLLNYEHACKSACSDNMKIATTQERTDVINSFPTLDEKDQARAVLAKVKELCISTLEKRPTGQIFLKEDFCACDSTGKPLISNKCENFCTSLSGSIATNQKMLYVNTTLGSEIKDNAKLGNLLNFCRVTLNDGFGAPNCRLVVKGVGFEQAYELLGLKDTNNSFQVNIAGIPQNKIFTMQVMEMNSRASSSIQNLDTNIPDENTDPTTPLKMTFASSYFCIQRSGHISPSGDYTDAAAKTHYFFASTKEPLPPVNTGNLACRTGNTLTDPLIGLTPQLFSAWDDTDIRFISSKITGRLDIDVIIEERLTKEYGINVQQSYGGPIKLFEEFRWPNAPVTSTNTTAQKPPRIGFIMHALIDKKTQNVYCPTAKDYKESADPLVKVLGESNIVMNDTEAVYLAEREPMLINTYDDSGHVTGVKQAPQDVILIPETLLKKGWYHIVSGKIIPATEASSKLQQVYFNWPYNSTSNADPMNLLAGQARYLIKAPSDIGGQNDVILTNIPAPDRRYGCLPKMIPSF